MEGIEIDEREFASLFQAELGGRAGAAPGGLPGATGNGAGRSVVQVSNKLKANNAGIILARLRMSYDDMAKAVERM